jgi:hypothetical protein
MNRFLLAFLATATAALAAPAFPGLKAIMSPQEFHRAGLDRLSPDQLGVIDAALIRHYLGTVKAEAAQEADKIVQQTVAHDEKKSMLQRFGLPDISFNQEWKDQAGLKARVTGWVGGNSFKLDNGQVWEGTEPIPYELANREIEIAPRPDHQFALIIEGKNTTVRVRRVK